MQDEISTTTPSKTRKTANGKWKQASEEVATASEDTSSVINDVMGTARNAYDSVVSRGSDLMSKVDLSRGTTIIRDYPVQAALGGLLVGFLLGTAFSRRRA